MKWRTTSKNQKRYLLGYFYWELKLNQFQIAGILGITQTGVSRIMRRLGVSRRSSGEAIRGIHKWGGSRTCPWIAKSNIERPRVKRHIATCTVCRKIFSAPKSSKRVYCSNRCKAFDYRVRFKGRNVSSWIKQAHQTLILNKTSSFVKLNKNPTFQKKRMNALAQKPTKPERVFMEIIERNNLPFQYVGNGAIVIGTLNPDFISNDKNKIIEIFGRVYHDPEVSFFALDWKRQAFGRLASYAQFGYDCLILWDDELDEQEVVVNKVRSFLNRKMELNPCQIQK